MVVASSLNIFAISLCFSSRSSLKFFNLFSAFSCTNGYTYSGVNTGSSYTSAQTATINNNNQSNNTTCTATFAQASCTVTRTGSNGFSATYSCENGTGTMTACRYSGSKGSATCNGGEYGSGGLFLCTVGTSYNYYTLSDYCNTLLPNSSVYGGGMSLNISCSC